MATLRVLIEDKNMIHDRKIIGYKYYQTLRSDISINTAEPRIPIVEPMPGYEFVLPERPQSGYQLIARRR